MMRNVRAAASMVPVSEDSASGEATGRALEMNGEPDNVVGLVRAFLGYQADAGLREVVLPLLHDEPTRSLPLLSAIREELGDCSRCPLHRERSHIVFGEGNPAARVMFVGEGPGADEDREGRPFVGRAGKLLTRMIGAMGLDRTDVYITNVVKCRPPGNRDPEAGEITTCLPFLEAQIKAVRPEALVTLGRVAASTLLGRHESLGRIRGEFHYWHGIPVMPTYHPSYLLRQEPDRHAKAQAWDDLKMVMTLLGLPVPGSGVRR